MRSRQIWIWAMLATMLLGMSGKMSADDRIYRFELGLDGGCGYYIGDANYVPFKHVREAYGANFRFMFDRRWSLRLKGMEQRITGYNSDGTGFVVKDRGMWQNHLTNIDVVGEFNFLPFDGANRDTRIKSCTPYIATGVGVSIHSGWKKVAAYMPFILGLKWRCTDHLTIHAAWEHDVYFSDGMENVPEYNNLHGLNGANVMNMDVTGQLVVGLAIAFYKDKFICRSCTR